MSESESLGTHRGLPTAKTMNLTAKPCDICEKSDKPVSFWGATSVLTSRRPDCLREMDERWQPKRTTTMIININ